MGARPDEWVRAGIQSRPAVGVTWYREGRVTGKGRTRGGQGQKAKIQALSLLSVMVAPLGERGVFWG